MLELLVLVRGGWNTGTMVTFGLCGVSKVGHVHLLAQKAVIRFKVTTSDRNDTSEKPQTVCPDKQRNSSVVGCKSGPHLLYPCEDPELPLPAKQKNTVIVIVAT